MTPAGRAGLASEAVRAAPSMGAIGAWLMGIPVEKWVAVAGLIFISIQTGGYLWRLRRDMLHEREREASRLPPPDSED